MLLVYKGFQWPTAIFRIDFGRLDFYRVPVGQIVSIDVRSAADEKAASRWFAIQTRPRKEQLALQHLKNQHFSTFCPLRRTVRRVGRHRVDTLEPLFPSYLFVQLDLEHQAWRSINGTIGVIRLVGSGADTSARPAAVPQGLIEELQARSDGTGELHLAETFSTGDRVRIVSGPFERLCGVLESAGDLERVTILLELMSKATPVRLPRHLLISA